MTRASSSKSGALAVAAGIFVSRIIGFVRDRAFAHYFGNGEVAGAFRAAMRIPNLLQNLFGEGALSASFIPVYAKLLAEGKHEEAKRVASAVLGALTLLMAVLVALGVTFADPLTHLFASGFEPHVRELTVSLVRIMAPGVGLLVLSAWCLGVLNSHRKFFLAYVAPIAWSLAMIVALLWFGGRGEMDVAALTELAQVVAWSTVVGAALQFGVQLPAALRANGGLAATMALTPPVRRIATNFLPATASRGVVQISAIIDQNLGSYLGPAAVSTMFYGQTIYMLPVSLFGIAVSASELPAMASTIGAEAEVHAALRARQTAGLKRLAFFVVPSAVAFLALGDVVVGTLYQTGKFSATDVRGVWGVLAGSSVALLANTQGRLVTSGLWALGDTRTPFRLSILRLALTSTAGIAVTFWLRFAFGLTPFEAAALLTLSSSLAGWVELSIARRVLAGRIGKFSFEWAWTGKFFAAAAVAAVVGFGAKTALKPLEVLPPWALGGIVLGTYSLVYGVVTYALGAPEARRIGDKILRKARLKR